MQVFVWAGAFLVAAIFPSSLILAGGTGAASLLAAAGLMVLVGAAHSLLGERVLVRPILAMDGLPVILGGVHQTRTIIRVAWHITTFFWWGLAALTAYMALVPASLSLPFLRMIAVIFGLSGVATLSLSRGAHKSWVFFFAIAALSAHAIVTV